MHCIIVLVDNLAAMIFSLNKIKSRFILRVRKTGFLLSEYVLAYVFVKMLAGPPFR